MEVIKDQNKRIYVYTAFATPTVTAVVSPAVSTSPISWNNYSFSVLQSPQKTNLVPKKIQIKVNIGTSFQLAQGANATSTVEQSTFDSFFITVLGQRLLVKVNSPNEFFIDSHYFPTLQDYSQYAQGLVANVDTTQQYFQCFQIDNTPTYSVPYWTKVGQNVDIFVQITITE